MFNFFKRKSKQVEQPSRVSKLLVMEGVEGRWNYHLSDPRNKSVAIALCGATVMHCYTRLEDWGFPSQNQDLKYKYCQSCADAAEQLFVKELP